MLLSMIMATTAKAETILPDGLHAEVAHVALTQDGKAFSVVQMVDIVNSSKEPSPELRIPLPTGAANFGAMDGTASLQGSQVVIAAGIAPGEKRQVGFEYTLPAGATTELTLTDIPPADLTYLLIDEAALSLDPVLVGKGFNDLGLAVINQVAYHQYEVTRPPGAPVTIKVNAGGNPTNAAQAIARESKNPSSAATGGAGDPKLLNGSFHGGSANVMLWQRMTGSSGHGGLVGISVLGLVLAGAVGLVATVIRRHSQAMLARTHAPAARAENAGEQDLDELFRQKKVLAQRIVEIDRKAALQPSPQLDQQRSVAKQRLMQVIRQIRDLESHAN